jgi:hypothetical protein
MNVVKKFYDALPKHWQELIEKNGWFDLRQFNFCVAIHYEDGSYMFFKYAFVVHDEGREEIAVFTEHCGYFVLPTRGLEWHVLKRETTQTT